MLELESLFMNKMSLSLIAALCLLSSGRAQAAAGDAAPPPAKPADLFPDATIAKGKGFEIKRSQLDDAVTGIKATAVARGQQIPPEQLVMMEQQVLELTPLRKYAKHDEVAKAALFLASSDSSHTTGESLNVSGGRLMS